MKVFSRLLVAFAVTMLAFAPGASWAADTPTKHHLHVHVSAITVTHTQAQVTVTHDDGTGRVRIRLHVNLRPDSTPGGGPGTHNQWVTITGSTPSPTVLGIDLPAPRPGLCWAQVDVRWPTGFRTMRLPLGGCTIPSPSPSPTPAATPSMTPHPAPSAQSTAATLPKTGSADYTWVLATLAVGLIGLGVLLVVTGERIRRH